MTAAAPLPGWLFAARWLRERRPKRRRRPLHSRPRRRADQLGLPLPAPIQLPLPVIGRPLLLVRVVQEGHRRRVLPLAGELLYVQFPRALRTRGAVYVVADLVRVERPRQLPFLRAVGPFRLFEVAAAPPPRHPQEGAHGEAR